MGYVVIINTLGTIPLRHIITIHHPYDEEEFKQWYYSVYQKLEGDQFTYCSSRQDMLRYIEEVKRKYDN